MALHPSNQFLVDDLQSLSLLANRFSSIQLVNYNSATALKRGTFSLVFRAHDTVEDKSVALKFFDLSLMTDIYRQQSFRREAEILITLLNAQRCLQLVKGLSNYDLQVPVATGTTISVPCLYFVTDWITDDIDNFFYNQQAVDVVDKLFVFNEIILAVEALHSREVAHRDLKVDNLRADRGDSQRLIIAIDLGTAARLDSQHISTEYHAQVGAREYAAPEAIGGLGGVRSIGHATDAFAVGCLLFELFNPDSFYNAIRVQNPALDLRLAAMSSGISMIATEHDRISAWHDALAIFSPGVSAIPSEVPGSSLPPGLAGIIGTLISDLTNIDYRRRISLRVARQRLWMAIRTYKNAQAYQIQLTKRRLWRSRRLEKARKNAERLARLEKTLELKPC